MNNSNNQNLFHVHKPSLHEKLFFFISGIVTSVPLTLFANLFTDSLCVSLPFFYAQICSIAIFTPFVEEFSKAYPLFYRHGETVRSLFSLGFLVGLGFGLAEFVLYVFIYNSPWFVRLPGLFFHAASASIVAYGIKTNRAWLFYLIAVLLHLTIKFASLIPSLWILMTLAFFSAYYLSWYINKQTTKPIQEN
ncbi:PrsW family intramembrane metalloprotease [Candidatus Bathyarchaeota archaeon]|nr:PrsW family intramembrane metalloprotease [Candidatus Bathyarchaeota archaeon]